MPTFVETLNIPLSQSNYTMMSAPTEEDKLYTLVFSGIGQFSSDPINVADFFWRFYQGNWVQDGSYTLTTGFTLNATTYPPRNPAGEYTLQVVGNGTVWGFKFTDTAYSDNTGSFSVSIYSDPWLVHEGADCQTHHAGREALASAWPISLHDGEKRLRETDLVVNSVAEPLTFTRIYRQNKRLDAGAKVVGAGWTHNHDLKLTFTPSSGIPDKIDFQTSDGGKTRFRKTATDYYTAYTGSTAFIERYLDSSLVYYRLTTPDTSIYIFDSAGKLLSRTWPNDEKWMYTYTSIAGADRLTKIADDYGRELNLTYYTTGDYKQGMVWRVGDHTSGSLSAPTSRYVEYTYTQEKLGGVVASNPLPLLQYVQDTRRQVWNYYHYGEAVPETDSNKRIFFTRRSSPPLDTDGDGDTEPIILTSLDYTLTNGKVSQIIQKRGAVNINLSDAKQVTEFNFQPQGQNLTEEKVGGKTTIHYFDDNTLLLGSQNPAGAQPVRDYNGVFRPSIQADARGNETDLEWNSSGKLLNRVTDALGQETRWEFNAGSDTLQYSLDTEGRKTVRTYGDAANPRQPTIIKVFKDVAETNPPLMWQTFTYDSRGRTLTEKLLDPANGTTVLRQVTNTYYGAGNNGAGLLHTRTLHDLQNAANNLTTTHFYDTFGRLVQVNQSRTFGSCTKSLTLYDAAGNMVAAICNFEPNMGGTASTDVNGSTATDGFDGSLTTYWTSTNLTTAYLQYDFGSSRLLNWLALTARATNLTEMVNAFTVQGSANGTAWTTVATVTNQTHWAAHESRVYHFANTTAYRYWRVLFTAVNGATQVSLANLLFLTPTAEDNQVTVHEYDGMGRRVKTTTDAGAAHQMTTLMVYDGIDRIVRTIGSYNTATSGVTNYVTAAHSAFGHGTDNTDNLVTDTLYNERGHVRQQVDEVGNVTLFGYDDADRLIKTIRNASQPMYNNNYTSPGDPDLSNYVASSLTDQDLITLNTYDATGNLVKSIDEVGRVTLLGYDALNRLVKTIQSASQPAYSYLTDPDLGDYVAVTNPDQDLMTTLEYNPTGQVRRTTDPLGNVTLLGYDLQGRQVKVIRNASQPTYDVVADADLSSYIVNSAADKDIVAITVYDPYSRVMYQEDVNGRKHWFGYDGLDRQVKAIINAQGTATDGGNSDPRSSTYSVNTDPDKDIIRVTTYDAEGRIKWTQDALGRYTLYGYDDRNRVVRVVRNASNHNYDTLTDPDLSSYTPNGLPDEDRITQTVDDAAGRVVTTIDERGNRTFFVYDKLGRQLKQVQNAKDAATIALNPGDVGYDATNDPRSVSYTLSADTDRDVIMRTVYDHAGRVTKTFDPVNHETRYEYDAASRLTKTTVNYVDGTFSAASPDEDLISLMTYDKAGQLLTTTDVRGTKTVFTYDGVGRRLTVIYAADTAIAATTYTCYDKAGRVLRVIQNWNGLGVPDAKDGNDNWLFNPVNHGIQHDQNRVTEFNRDRLGRETRRTDPLGNQLYTNMTYAKDGRVLSTTDPLGVVRTYRYDQLNRLVRRVQGYVSNGIDPANWVWSGVNNRWENGSGTALYHGTNNDQNIILDLTYDKAGRRLTQRDPMGQVTTYTYDKLNRRKTLVNPASQDWVTTYADVNGGLKVTVNDPSNYDTERIFDRMGRLKNINYLAENPKLTPDVTFAYDRLGNRTEMSELAGSLVRKTTYGYDDMNRLLSVAEDTDGSGTPDQTVQYEYDAGGLRTKLILPGNLTVTYTYNARGQLVSLQDWDSQTTTYTYDQAGRNIHTKRPNGFSTHARYDAKGQLKWLQHLSPDELLQEFGFAYDKRGNRGQIYETRSQTSSGVHVFMEHYDPRINYYKGQWTSNAGFMSSTDLSAALSVSYYGKDILIGLGTGADGGICDIYLDQNFWGSVDTYAATPDYTLILIPAYQTGAHTLEIHNRRAKHPASSGNTLSLKNVQVQGFNYTHHRFSYVYDHASRLQRADDTDMGPGVDRRYYYDYDLIGNRTNQKLELNGVINSDTTYTYNNLNQLTGDGTNTYDYDSNGNLWKTNTVITHTWDRANRLLSHGGINYGYNGVGQRVRQQAGASTTNYLLDMGIPLYNVIAATTGANTTRYIHDRMGVFSQENPDGSWNYMMLDGLGSVRGLINANANILGTRQYDPYGVVWETLGSINTPFDFTGEPKDSNGLLHLRARDYNPALGVFTKQDPLEFVNRYSYVMGNPVNNVDPTGMICLSWDCAKDTIDNVTGVDLDNIGGEIVEAGAWVGRLPGDVSEAVGIDRGYADDFVATQFGVAGDIIGDASIVPRLIVENPRVAFQAIGRWAKENPDDAALAATAWLAAPAVAIAAPGLAASMLAYGYLGATSGFVGGYAYGNAMYNMAASGQCGCERQQMVLGMGRDEFVRYVAKQGTEYGAIGGLTAGAGWGGQMVAGGASIITGGNTMRNAGSEMWSNRSIDPCNALDFLVGTAGILGGYKLTRQGWRGSAGFRQATDAGHGFYDYVEMLPNGIRISVRYTINLASNTIDQVLYEFDLGTPNLVGDLPKATIRHILTELDKPHGGHSGGLGVSNKSEFPPHWNDMRILNAAVEVLTNPNSVIVNQTGPIGSRFTNAGVPSKIGLEGTVSGVKIRVIWEPEGRIVVTAHPTNLPRNP